MYTYTTFCLFVITKNRGKSYSSAWNRETSAVRFKQELLMVSIAVSITSPFKENTSRVSLGPCSYCTWFFLGCGLIPGFFLTMGCVPVFFRTKGPGAPQVHKEMSDSNKNGNNSDSKWWIKILILESNGMKYALDPTVVFSKEPKAIDGAGQSNSSMEVLQSLWQKCHNLDLEQPAQSRVFHNHITLWFCPSLSGNTDVFSALRGR